MPRNGCPLDLVKRVSPGLGDEASGGGEARTSDLPVLSQAEILVLPGSWYIYQSLSEPRGAPSLRGVWLSPTVLLSTHPCFLSRHSLSMEDFTCPQSVDFFTEPESFAPPQDSSDPGHRRARSPGQRLRHLPRPEPGCPHPPKLRTPPTHPPLWLLPRGLNAFFMAIGVEVLRHISVHQDGLTNSVIRGGNSQITHLLYTVVIVAASQPVVALWA